MEDPDVMKKDHIQIFAKGIEGKTMTLRVHKDSTVDNFLALLSKRNGIPVSTQRVLYGSKQLEPSQGKYLSDYGINNDATVFVVLRLLGGSTDTLPPPKELDDGVELTDAPDMITWDDDPDGQRAKMPCGHAIGPDSLTAYCRSLLTSGRFRFLCPYINPDPPNDYCGQEWSYVDVRRLAVLTEDERKEFETKITQNYLKRAAGIQECPRCSSLCERVNKKDKRVVCPLCTKKLMSSYDFCWHCLHPWKTSGVDKCGNAECSGEDHRLKILRECKKKQIVGVKDCPSRRACIACGLLIEHEKACKHMVCPCGQQFCFICLKPAVNGRYQCGTFNQACTVAKVQTNIPGAGN